MNALKKHVLFQDAAVIKMACKRLRHLSIDGYIFMRRFPDGTFVDLSNELEWSDNFLPRYLDAKIDIESAQDHTMIRSGLSLWSQNPGNTIWQEARNDWGFNSGLSIAKEGPSWMDTFCFYSRSEPAKMDPLYLKNFQLLERFNLFFVDQFHDLILKGKRDPLVIPKVYLQQKDRDSLQDKFLKSITGRKEPLTVRELECVYHIAKGNTAAETGKILNISRRTVESHLSKAKDKMQASKTSDLIKMFPEW